MTEGTTSVTPTGQRVRSPATFTYTAPGEVEEAGFVQLRTVSRRGIAVQEVYFNTHGREVLAAIIPPAAFVGEISVTFFVEDVNGSLLMEVAAIGVRFELVKTLLNVEDMSTTSLYEPVSGTVTFHMVAQGECTITTDATASIPRDVHAPVSGFGTLEIRASNPQASTYVGNRSAIELHGTSVGGMNDAVCTTEESDFVGDDLWLVLDDRGPLPVAIENGAWILAGTKNDGQGADWVWRFTGNP